jgi:hypothetical protein
MRRMTSRAAAARAMARMIQPQGVDDDVGVVAIVVVVVDEVVVVVSCVLVVVVVGAVVVVVGAVVVVVVAGVVVVVVDSVVVGWANAGDTATDDRFSANGATALATKNAMRRRRPTSILEA